jgi:uncharacterized membrane protein YgcG
VTHPDESVLLAYIRRQPCDGWSGDLQQHIRDCSICSSRCVEYDQIGTLLETWARSRYFQTYPPLTERVMQRLNAPAPSLPLRLPDYAKVPTTRLVSVSVALALVMLFSIVFFAMAYKYGPLYSGTKGSHNKQSTATIVMPSIKKMPTATPVNSDTGPGSKNSGPTITVCSTSRDVRRSVLRICGTNFMPGDYVSLVVSIPGRPPWERQPVHVNQSGNMQDAFSVNDCRSVPSSIVAVDISNTSEVSQVLTGIQGGNCPGNSPDGGNSQGGGNSPDGGNSQGGGNSHRGGGPHGGGKPSG